MLECVGGDAGCVRVCCCYNVWHVLHYSNWLCPALQLFQDRLEAVEVMLLQKPIVSGRYTAYAFRHFVLPLDAHFRAVWQR